MTATTGAISNPIRAGCERVASPPPRRAPGAAAGALPPRLDPRVPRRPGPGAAGGAPPGPAGGAAAAGPPGGGQAAGFPRRELAAAGPRSRRRSGRRAPARPPVSRETLAIGVRGHVAGRRRGRPATRLIDDGPGLGHRRVRRWIAGGQDGVARLGVAAPRAVTVAVHAQPGGTDGRAVPHRERAGRVDRARLARHGRVAPDRAPPPR